MRHDAFISYSHAADGMLAPALQQGLEQFAKRWYRRRALAAFRDETNLSASPQLWQSIVDELAQSRWFLFLASPEAARSKWVAREVAWWLQNRDARHLLILLTGGELLWDEAGAAPDFDWARTTALPANLKGVFAAEPHFIDLRALKQGDPQQSQLTLKHTAFRAAVLKVAAPLHGRSPDEMDGEAVRVHARNRRWAAGAVASLAVLAALATWQSRVATLQRDIAISRQLSAQSIATLGRSVDTAMLLAVQAWRISPTAEARSAMLRSLQLGPIARFLPSHTSPIVDVALSPDASWAMVASLDGDITRLRLDGSAPDWRYRSDQPIERMALSSDGARMAIGRRDGQVEVLEPGRAPPLHRLETPMIKEPITALAFTSDGGRLAFGGVYGGIALWDTATGAALGGVPEVFNQSATAALVFSEDGQHLYGARGFDIVDWDTSTWKAMGKLGDGKSEILVRALALAPGGGALTVAGYQDQRELLQRWPLTPAGMAPVALPTRLPDVISLAHSADGRVLVLGSSSGQLGFQIAGTESSFKAHNGEVRTVAISSDGHQVLSGGKDGRIILWAPDAQPRYRGRLGAASRGFSSVAASPDGRLLVSGSQEGQLLWITSAADAPQLHVGAKLLAVGEARGTRGITAVSFSPDGKTVAAGLGDGSIVRVPVDGSAPPPPMRDWSPGYPVVALAWSPDGGLLVSAHVDGSVVLRDAATGAPRGNPANIVNDSSDGIHGLAFSADGSRLLVSTLRRGVVQRDVAALANANRATVDSALALTARAASAVRVSAVAHAPADRLWAWGTTDGQVQMRKTDDRADGPPLAVEGGLYLDSLAISPDGGTLAASGGGDAVLLWDLRTRRPVDEALRGITAGRSMAFTPDSRFLVIRSGANELQWWSTDGNDWARMLCAIVHRPFTARERVTYFGDEAQIQAACEDRATAQPK
ncbi:MAG: TIR domain-containing protein [Rubrivivax sp.]